MTESKEYRYPLRTRLNVALSLLVYVWFFLTGLWFLATDLPDAIQGRIGMGLAVVLFGVGGSVLVRRQLRLMSAIELASDGLHVRRLGDEVLFLRWEEIEGVRKRRMRNDYVIRSLHEETLVVERRLIGLDELLDAVEARTARAAGTPATGAPSRIGG